MVLISLSLSFLAKIGIPATFASSFENVGRVLNVKRRVITRLVN
jgi:hypothetical protein